MTATCPRCATPIGEGARHCSGCGLEVDARIPARPGSFHDLETQALPSQIDLLRHATLGEYEILAELGRGGMATVYLGHDVTLNRKVAIKVISADMLLQPSIVERFKREARTAGGLSHPHVVPVYAVRQEEQLLFFVMKYVAGRSLDKVLPETGPLPLGLVGAILGEAASALDYAHRQGVIHRDVKPGNLLIDEEGFTAITDFGIAKAAEAQGLTRTGTMVGTPAYLSPEVCQGEPATVASDQYSLGIVAYELVAGALPFQSDSQVGMIYAHLHERPRQLRELRPDCPPELEAIILRMLEKDPAARWPSIKDAGAAITTACPLPDDAVRARIGELARNRPERELALRFVTPTSPIPGGARRTPASSPTLPPVPIAAPSRVALWPLIAGGVVAALAIAVALRSRGPQATSPAAVVADKGDSLWLEARGGATVAREQAVRAGVPAKQLGAGDSLRQLAESLATRGQKSQAAVVMTQAVAAWNTAAAVRKPAGQPALTTAPATPKREAASPAPALTPSDSQIVVDFYRRLGDFIRARQLGEVKRLISNLNGREEDRWRDLFQDKDIEAINPLFTVRAITRRGDQIYAKVDRQLTLSRQGGRADTRTSTVQVILTLGPDGWRQISSEDVR